MAFLNKNVKEDICYDDGWVYIFLFNIGEDVVYKIGITRRCDKEKMPMQRFLEVLGAMYYIYGGIPASKIKKYRKCKDIRKVESILHEEYKAFRYHTPKQFAGSTELFSGMDVDELFARYEELIEEYS